MRSLQTSITFCSRPNFGFNFIEVPSNAGGFPMLSLESTGKKARPKPWTGFPAWLAEPFTALKVFFPSFPLAWEKIAAGRMQT